MREPVVALAFTPEPWVESLHRHFTDHGGARIRQLVMDPIVALDDDYEILITSARWPALTPGFVAELHDRHRAVLGVASRDDHGSADVLAYAGVDRVIMADAGPAEFLEALLVLAPSATADRSRQDDRSGDGESLGRRIVVRGPAGAGATEVAIGLADALARRSTTGLIDLDDVAPSVAQRLALPIEPNLRTAIDAIEFGIGDHDLATDSGRLHVVAGLPNPAAWNQVRPTEVERVVRALARHRSNVVIDIAAPLEDVGQAGRQRHGVARAMLGSADIVVAVGAASPVGLTRLVSWLAEAHRILDTHLVPVHVVLDRVPADRFRAGELVAEFERCYGAASLTLVPEDTAIHRAMWDGDLVRRGPFADRMRELAGSIVPMQSAEAGERRRWRIPRRDLVRAS